MHILMLTVEHETRVRKSINGMHYFNTQMKVGIKPYNSLLLTVGSYTVTPIILELGF